jgi:hypothetical protein
MRIWEVNRANKEWLLVMHDVILIQTKMAGEVFYVVP